MNFEALYSSFLSRRNFDYWKECAEKMDRYFEISFFFGSEKMPIQTTEQRKSIRSATLKRNGDFTRV